MEVSKVKKARRLLTIMAAAALSVASVAVFAGCDTNYPEVTFTYEFNGTEYEVHYTLSRKGAPQTVQHFIELADAGYYDGTVIHDYQSNGTYLYAGGYTWDGTKEEVEGKLIERDYWSWVKNYEKENNYTFTQSVYTSGGDPLYTVYGEFSDNGCTDNSKKYNHSYSLSPGALVMYYTDKGSDGTRVSVSRSDSGDNNNGSAMQDGNQYKYNSASSLIYTWTGTGSLADRDRQYCVFGCMKDYSEIQALLDAVKDYEEKNLSGEEEKFTETVHIENVNQYDPIDNVRNSRIPADYNVPVEPIYLKKVKVTNY